MITFLAFRLTLLKALSSSAGKMHIIQHNDNTVRHVYMTSKIKSSHGTGFVVESPILIVHVILYYIRIKHKLDVSLVALSVTTFILRYVMSR